MKTVDFSETIATSDLKIGRSRHLNDCMKVYDIEGQGHFLTSAQGRVNTKFKPYFLRNYCADLK